MYRVYSFCSDFPSYMTDKIFEFLSFSTEAYLRAGTGVLWVKFDYNEVTLLLSSSSSYLSLFLSLTVFSIMRLKGTAAYVCVWTEKMETSVGGGCTLLVKSRRRRKLAGMRWMGMLKWEE